MAHILTDLLRIQLRAVKPIMRPGKLNASRTLQDKLGELMHKAHSAKTEMLRQDFVRFEACWVLPKKEAKRGVILYLHGGGYVAGDLPYALGFGSVLADDLQRRVFCAAYRLAPEHPFPAALEDALTAYQYLLAEGLSGRDIVLCGESAGGGLIWALSLKLKELGLELPAGIIGISPWVDLSLSGSSYQENEKLDPCLTLELLEYYAEVYAGGPSRAGSAPISMDGRAVFRFAVDALPRCLHTVLDETGKTLDEVDWVVCHQANSRIIDHCVRALHADPAKFYKNMDRHGNTSAASIPVALNELAETGQLQPGQTIACIGFGGGLTWGGMIVEYKK